jgi:hypothetical protein
LSEPPAVAGGWFLFGSHDGQMNPLSPDTTPEAQRKHHELMRGVPSWKRLALAFELTQAMRQLVVADLQHRFPEADKAELRRRFIARVLPHADVIRAYGFDPVKEGY